MGDTANKVRRLKLQNRMKRLNTRSNNLSKNMYRVEDTIFALRARIEQHGDSLGEEAVRRLTERLVQRRRRYGELKAERDIIRSGISYLQLNRAAIEDGAEEIGDI